MYQKRVFCVGIASTLAILMLLWVLRTTNQLSAREIFNEDAAVIHNLQVSQEILQFTLTTPPVQNDENGRLFASGLETRIQQPGAPALPYFVRYIALPPEANAIITIVEKDVQTNYMDTIQPAPTAAVVSYNENSDFAFTEPIDESQLTYDPDQTIYGANAIYPPAAFAVSEPMYYRDIRLVALELYPLRYNPVTRQLFQARQVQVSVTFTGAQWDNLRPSPAHDDVYLGGLSGLLLNEAQARQWRSLPESVINAPTTELPVGVDTYKIELNQDGIYEISYANLAAAGMNVAAVNPHTFEMMYRGEPVAYQFIGDADTTFESGERIRFYGWAFDGPRTEKQFISANVFWLWANGTPTIIPTTSNLAGSLPVVTATLSAVTHEPENNFFSTWTDRWPEFPNEPDAWYWDYVVYSTPLTKSYPITLPHPVSNGPAASYTVELMSREAPASPAPFTYVVRASLNNYPVFGQHSWERGRNVNVIGTIPLDQLVDGLNTAVVVYATNTGSSQARVYLNRVTVEYLRRLISQNNQLLFTGGQGGLQEFHVSGFSEGNFANTLVWNLADRLNPVQIEMSAANIVGGNPFTYTIGSDQPAGTPYIATTAANILTNNTFSISRYVVPNLNPLTGAEWLAITHANFMAEANQLASHRAQPDFGGLTTHIVDIEDIINQYGYGLPLPDAVHDYLEYALGHWAVAPSYVIMLGDATLNPRQLNCLAGCFTWDVDEPTYVLTDLVFEDRFQGVIPSDHTFVTVSGSDLLPDMAIGRISASHPLSVTSAISKIILYEQNILNEVSWSRNVLFVADNTDGGGNFCSENATTGLQIPDDYTQTHLCLPGSVSTPPTITETNALRAQMSSQIHLTGTLFLNYRGHGSIQYWAGPPNLLDVNNLYFWTNSDKPLVILSADCLDGHFAWPGASGLGENFFMRRASGVPVGSAAHWSSSGLGYTLEHTALMTHLYEGIFQKNLVAVGDATNYAKMRYDLMGFPESELYSFILQGDPAMGLLLPTYELYLPVLASVN